MSGNHRNPYFVERDLDRYRRLHPQLFPALEATPDISRGETRLAAEVALSIFRGDLIPESAKLKAFEILSILAKG